MNNKRKSPFLEMMRKSNNRSSKNLYIILILALVFVAVVASSKTGLFSSRQNLMEKDSSSYLSVVDKSATDLNIYYTEVIAVATREKENLSENYYENITESNKYVEESFSTVLNDDAKYKDTLEYAENYGQIFIAVDNLNNAYKAYYIATTKNVSEVIESSSISKYQDDYIEARSNYFLAKKELDAKLNY